MTNYNDHEGEMNTAVLVGDEEKEQQPEAAAAQQTVDFIDREKSWLEFNLRVIKQCERENDIPLEQRLEFVGIATSNLDEFVSVRYAGLEKRGYSSSDIEEICNSIKEQRTRILRAFMELRQLAGLPIVNTVNGMDEQMDKIFKTKIYPALTPMELSSNKEIPVLDDNDINFFIKLTDEEGEVRWCFLQIPHRIPRLIKVDDNYFTLESVVEQRLQDIFNNKKVISAIEFTVNKRYTETVTHEREKKMTERVRDVIIKRNTNKIMFLNIKGEPSRDTEYLIKLLGCSRQNVFFTGEAEGPVLAMHFLKKNPFEMIKTEPVTEWNYKFKPRMPLELEGYGSIMEYLDEAGPLIAHNPYEEYLVPRFLDEAADDPRTLTIKQSLYRVSGVKSPIIKALCRAAERGVKVTVMLELLARFDETNNLNLINTLKAAGCTVVYSLENLKTHSKMCLITKAHKKGLAVYSHVGTGNYNEKTAGVYTDISYFTANRTVAYELNTIFNMITGFSQPESMRERVWFSPVNLRSKLYEELDKSVMKAKANPEDKINICIKVNSISDADMVKRILEVADSCDNICFRILCRGICSIPYHKNIEVHSVVGRFLEHSRIYCFETLEGRDVFIASADLLTRNLDKRIETMIKINAGCEEKVMDIFNILWQDTANTWVMSEGNKWRERACGKSFNGQNYLTMHY